MVLPRFPPWFADHQLGALDVRVPDVRGVAHVFPRGVRDPDRNPFQRTWTSRKQTLLSSEVKARREDFDLPAEAWDPQLVDGSLNHRTLSARVRFVDFTHSYEDKKRARDGDPLNATVHRSAKEVRAKFNAHGGAARFVWNKAVAFIRRQPANEQTKWYNVNKLYPVLVANKTYKDRDIKRREAETDDEYAVRVRETEERRQKMKDEKADFAGEGLVTQNAWLGGMNSVVLQQSLKALDEAFKANVAAARVARATGRGARRFKIGFLKRSKPSSWTFVLPAVYVKAEHVPRPTRGPAAQDDHAPRTWTKLTLPAALGGSDKDVHSPSKAYFGAIVYLTSKIDLTPDGHPLADMDFTRDSLGRWNVHWQRAPLKAPRPKAPETAAFLDPGSRTGNTAYFPCGVKSCDGDSAVFEYMAGEGGATRIFSQCLKVDDLVSRSRAIKPPRKAGDPPVPPLSREESRMYHDLKTREHRLRARIYNLVRDAHVRVVADLFSKADTVVVPVFDTHRMARRRLNADDPRRRINNKTVRQLFSLRHGGFRDRLRHAARVMGKEVSFPGEEYTTVGCPRCLRVNEKFSGTRFACAFCDYAAPRDVKSGLTYAIKCLRAP